MLKASEIKRGDVVFLDQAPHAVKHLETKSPSSRGAVTLYKLRFKNLLNGSKKTPLGVWKKMTSAPVMNINHGDSLLDRLSTATVRSLTSVPLYNG